MPNQDELLLHVRVLAEGQQDLAKLQSQMVGLFQKTTVAQQQQASAAERHANILGGLATRVNLLSGHIQSLQLRLYEMGEAFAFVGIGLAGITFGVSQAKEVISAGAQFEKWETGFDVLKGGAAAARQQMEYLIEFTKHTNFELPDVVEASKQLEALDLDSRKYLKTLADTAAFMNTPLTEAVLALSAVRRGEFRAIERFVPDIQALMQRAGIDVLSNTRHTGAQMSKLIDQIMVELNEKYGGGTERLAETTDGKLTRIKDMWFEFRVKIAQSGVGDAVNKILGDILDKLNELEANGTMQRWARHVSDAMISGIDVTEKMVHTLEDLKGPITFLAGAAGVALLARGVSALALAVGAATIKAVGYIDSSIAAAAADRAAAAAAAMRAAGYEALALEMEAATAAGTASVAATTVATGGLAVLGRGLLALVGGPVGAFTIGTLGLAYVLDKLAAAAKPAAEREADLRKEFDDGKISADQYREALEKLQAQKDRQAKTAPEDAMRAQDQAFAQGMLARAGEPIGHGKKKRTTPPEPDPEAIKAHQEAVRQLVTEWAAGVKERIDLTEFEAKTQVALLEQIRDTEVATVKDAYQKKLELHDIDKMINDAKHRAAIEAAKKEADAEIDTMRKTAALRGEDTQEYLQDLQRRLAATDKFSIARLTIQNEIKATEKKLADERMADLRFESELQGQTTQQYIFLLRAKLSVLSATSEEAKAIIAEINRVSEDAVKQEQQRTKTLHDLFFQRAEDRRNAEIELQANLMAAGEGQDQARRGASAASRFAQFETDRLSATQAYLAEAQGLYYEFFSNILGVADKTYAEMTEGERLRAAAAAALTQASYAAQLGFAHGFLARSEAEFQVWFRHRKTSEGMLVSIVKQAAQESAAAVLEGLSKEAAAEAGIYAAKALAALGEGFLGNPAGFVAAAKFGAAAAAFGLASGATAAGAANIRQSEQESQPGQSGIGGGNQAGSIGGQASSPLDNRIRLSQASQPITQYFYLSMTWEGGANFFGRDAADAIVQQIIPSLQEAIDSKQLRVPA